MNNIFNQILEETILEAETTVARIANKRRLSKWAHVRGVAILTGARSSKDVFLKIINGSDNAARENELKGANLDLSTTDNSGNFITKEPLPAGNYLIGVDSDIYQGGKIPIGDDKYELRQPVEFEIPKGGPGQAPVNVKLLLTKAQTTRHFDDDDAYVTAVQNGELKDGQIITIGPSKRKFVVADDVTSLIAVDDDGQPLTPEKPLAPDEPAVVERNFYNTTADQIIILANKQEEEWLKEIYLSIFNNQKDLAHPKNVEKLALLRVILSLEEPDNDVGDSTRGFKLITGTKERLKNKFPDFNLQAYYEFEEEDELDEYGILLPDVDTISPKRSDLTNLEARESQYRDKRLFDIIKNVNLDIEEFDIAKSEETPSDNKPLDPDENEPRFMLGGTYNGPVTPALRIYINDKNPKDGIPDDTWGYLFYGDRDPLGRRKKRRYDLNDFTLKWFGKTFKSYAKENREDFTREIVVMKKDGSARTGVFRTSDVEPGDVQVSVPNFWPIHVAMAYEELLETRTKQSAEQEYEAVLYFDTRAHKKRLKEQINNVKNLVRDTEKKEQKKYILQILDVDFVPRNLIVAPPKLKKILQKRVAYFGASAGVTIDPLTRKIKNLKPSFGNRDFGDIGGVLGAAGSTPLFNIGDNAKKYISGIGGRRISSQLIKLRVKGPTGESLYTHTFGSISIISESSQPPKKWAEIEDEVNLTIVSQPLEIIRPVNTLASVHVQAKSNFFGKDGTKIEISNGSIYTMPKNVISNNSVTEDNATDYSFSEPERVFAKRLGVRLDQDYKVDLVSGKTNFIFLNEYTWDGDKVAKIKRANKRAGGLTNKPYEPYAGSDVAPDDLKPDVAPDDLKPDVWDEEGWQSQGNIERYTIEVSRKYGIEPDLIMRHMWVESRYKQTALSSAGAVGLMQLMPKTAASLGVDPHDWKENIDGGAKFLSRRIRAYKRLTRYPTKLAAMAYFAGQGNIKKTIESARNENMDPVEYVEKKSKEASSYHVNIFNYSQSVHDDSHPTQKSRPRNLFIGKKDLVKKTGPILGNLPPKRDVDEFEERFKSYRNRLAEDQYADLNEFYAAIRECYENQSYLVLHDSDMNRLFDETHAQAYEHLAETVRENKCRSKIPTRGRKKLRQFQGAGKVQPMILKHAFATEKSHSFLTSLSAVSDGEWRIGDISGKYGGGIPHHQTHRTGEFIDVGIPLVASPGNTLLTLEEIKASGLRASNRPSRDSRGWGYITPKLDDIDILKSLALLGAVIDKKFRRVILDKKIIEKLQNYVLNNKENIQDKRLVKFFVARKRGRKIYFKLDHKGGHKDHFHINTRRRRRAMDRAGDESMRPIKAKSDVSEVLIFGNSQAGSTGMGGALKDSLKRSGFEVERLSFSGYNDNSLANKALEKIPKKDYKKAFLFLNGNVYRGNLMKASKIKIIDYMINTLNIPKENLTVILPPVNEESDKSLIRKPLSDEALVFFRAKGISTPDLIVASQDSFKDEVHASPGAPEVQVLIQSLTSNAIKKAKEIAGGEDEVEDQQEPRNLLEDEPEHGYILTDLKEEKVYATYNEKIGEKRSVFQGASMNKPIIALIHRMKYPKGKRKALTDEEIKGLLTYTAGGTQDSNNVNALISGGSNGIVHRSAKGKTKERLQKRLKSIGKLTVSDTKRYLKQLGLDENMKIRYTGNKHSPSQYHKFMKLIHNDSEINRLGIKEEVEEVLEYMKRTGMRITAGGRNDGGDRESARWPKYIKALNKAGVPVRKIYGKGGLVKSTFHYSLVIDDKYLLTIYTNRLNPRKKPFFKSYKDRDGKRIRSKDQHMSWFEGKLIEILKPVYSNKQKTNEALRKIFDLIDEATR